MTAINIYRSADAIFVLSDGAHYEPDGTMAAIAPKVSILPNRNALVGVRGPAGVRRAVHELIEAFQTFDETVTYMRHELPRGICSQFGRPPIHDVSDGEDFDIVLTGWSEERGGPEGYQLSSRPCDGKPAGQLVEIGSIFVSPIDEPTKDRFSATLSDDERQGVVADPPGLLLRFVEAQRLLTVPGADGAPIHGVGGFAQLTTITRDEISTKIVRRWPDRIGEKIDPVIPVSSD